MGWLGFLDIYGGAENAAKQAQSQKGQRAARNAPKWLDLVNGLPTHAL